MRFFKDFVLTLLTCAGVLLALEVGLRLAGAHYEASLYTSEDERGYALRPNSEGWSTAESDVYVRINSDGMRDHERPVLRPGHTLRVAVVGSSEADARQVHLEQTFESVLDRKLTGRFRLAGWQSDVLNFGVPGYTLSQEYLTLRNHVWKYDPQIVVFVFSAFQALKTTRGLFPEELKGAPVYVLQNGELEPDAITRATPPINPIRLRWKNHLSDWMNRVALLSLANSARSHVRRLVAGLLASGQEKSSPMAKSERWSYDPGDPEIRTEWAITEEFIRMMKRDCDGHRAEFWLVVVDNDMQSHPSLAERADYQRRLQLPSLNLVDQRLERLGEASGFPVLPLSVPLGDYAASHHTFLHGPLGSTTNAGHWNEIGHAQVGEAIARELLEHSPAARGLISPSLP
jgi:hypothetical protein